MESLLIDYRLDRPTWFYLSLLLVVAVYFRFGRVWSLRNLDLALLLSLSPGLLLVENGRRLGFVWLFAAAAAILARLLCDSLFTRRPRANQNLNTAGLVFLLGACGVFHVGEILTTVRLPASALTTASRATRLVDRKDAESLMPPKGSEGHGAPAGPVAMIAAAPAVGLSRAAAADYDLAVRITAILAHAAVVGALIVIGWRLYNDVHLGVAMATLYLILPCTAYNVAQVNHVLPCALILWAIVFYRNPYVSGGFLGLACGTLFLSAFLLPVWATFYGRKNAARFGAALAVVSAVLLASLTLTSADADSFVHQVLGVIDWSALDFYSDEATGVWRGIGGAYRMPVFALFVVMVGLLSWWPKTRTIEPLLARTAAVFVGTQFWYPQEGGVYLLWYVPLFLTVVFRPILSQLTAPPVVPWVTRWRAATPPAAPPERVATVRTEPVRPLFR
jgi:hypothetical protein